MPNSLQRLPVAPSVHPRPTGASLVIRALEDEGVEVCFGMPGGAILPIYDALAMGTTIRHVLVRHEQGAGHMAEGYARASGRPGVVLATSGPGATNLVTPIADARMDSTPLVCITGQVRSELIGTDAFQECAIVDVVRPLVKGAWQVHEVDELTEILHEAFALARAARPGPVLVDIPRDLQEATTRTRRNRRAIQSVEPPALAPGLVAAAAAAVEEAQRPVLYVGGGAQAFSAETLRFAERAQMPVVATLMGKGAFPERHPLFVGWPGMHGTKAANLAFHHADLIVAAGARFDDRVTGRVDRFAPEAKVVHIDVDARELGKIRHADIAMHAHLGPALTAVGDHLDEPPAHRELWRQELRALDERYPLSYESARIGEVLKPQDAVVALAEATATLPDVVWTTGVGQHQMWAMQYIPVNAARAFVTSGGLGTMGYGLPAAIGAALARPEATTICVDGDGSFQMTLQELATAAAERVPVIAVILNNRRLGMVHQWQTMFYEERLSASDLRPGMPSFATIARGYGAEGYEVSTLHELRTALANAISLRRPAVLDVLVDERESCFPIIPPGGAGIEQVEWQPRP